MTDTEINIAIAEACGWKQVTNKDFGYTGDTKWWTKNADNYGQDAPPSYATDLNAMHEAEKVLSIKGELVKQCYLDNLCVATNGESAEMDGSYGEVWAMSNATARERAEAFLRTLGKWKKD